jgi:hypothetical protein
MAMIYVKTKPGRRAYFEGKIIPEDQFVPVTDNPYIRRLADHWEDIEVQGGSDRSSPSQSKSKTVEKGPTAPVPGGGRHTIQPTGEQGPGTGAPKPRD